MRSTTCKSNKNRNYIKSYTKILILSQINQLVVDHGFKCPDELLQNLSPMEFEEMVSLFVNFDSNKSGTIDNQEAKKILQFLGMHATLDKTENLLNLVDVNKLDLMIFVSLLISLKEEMIVSYSLVQCPPRLENHLFYLNLKD